jgi:hypothetical protein
MSVTGRKATLTYCEICKQEVKYFNRHLAKHHPEISQLDYFNKYIRTSDKQGFCKTCSKPTTFFGPIAGFAIYCGAKCQMTDPDMQQKYRDNYIAKTGFEHNFKNPEIIDKIKHTQVEKYGGIGFASKELREKSLNGLDNCMHDPKVVEKVKTTRLANNNGVWCSDEQLTAIHEANKNPEKYLKAVQTKYIKNNGKYASVETHIKRENTMLKRFGVKNILQLPNTHANNMMPKTEKKLLEFLTHRHIEFEHNFYVNGKHFDFAIFKDNKLNLLIEIDGVYFHGLLEDCNGKKSRGDKDHERFNKVPEGVKFIVCDDLKLEECFAEILKVYYIDYELWIQSIIDSMPAEFPYPTYTEKRLAKDWQHLQVYEYNKNSFVGMSIIQQFHKSIWHAHKNKMLSPVECWKSRELLEKSVRNRVIYKSNLSSQQIARGFNISNIAKTVSVFNPIFAKHIILKYAQEYNEIFDPFSGFSGRMLGTCSTGKRYIGQDINETHVSESKRIIEKFNLNATVECKDVLISTGEYECLFTCSPYNLKEIWNDNETNLSCDEWIDECLKRFKCKRYIFVIDKTEKYKDNIAEELTNSSHFGVNNELLIVIDATEYEIVYG